MNIEKNKEHRGQYLSTPVKQQTTDEYIAYVAGVYQDGTYGWGVAFLKNNKLINSSCGYGIDIDRGNSVSGEIEATKQALNLAIESDEINKIIIKYNYSGIEHWATGRWKPKTTLAQEYFQIIKESKKRIDIEFSKIEEDDCIIIGEALASKGLKLATKT